MTSMNRYQNPCLTTVTPWTSYGKTPRIPLFTKAARLHNVFNKRMPRRFPRAIVKATDVQDVVAAVKLAAEHDCRVAVRSGGHSFPVWSVQDDSILVDLSALKEIVVDTQTRTARVSPSVTSAELNDVLIQQYEMMFPGGHHASVALGGFLLQGGMGWNCANWGWACELIDAVEVVTAHGELLLCNAQEHPDLYWAARGAGPGFPGIITNFHLKLLPYPRAGFRSSGYSYPAHLYREAFSWAISIAQSTPPDTEITVRSHYVDGDENIRIQVGFLCMKPRLEDTKAVLHSIHESHPPGALAVWCCREADLRQIYSSQKESPLRYYVDNSYIQNGSDIVSVLEQGFLRLPTRKSFALWAAMNPRSKQVRDDLSLSVHSDHYFVIEAIYDEEKEDHHCRTHVEKVMEDIERHSAGCYIGDSELNDPKRQYGTPQKTKRLIEIGTEWDPRNRFCRYEPTI